MTLTVCTEITDLTVRVTVPLVRVTVPLTAYRAAAIDSDDLSRDIGCIAQEIDHARGDVFWFTCALQWNLLQDCLLDLVRHSVFGPENGSWRNPVHPHIGCQVLGQ